MKLVFPKGLIISFEGLDCSFKESNYNAYKNALYNQFIYGKENSEYKIFSESFPRYGRISSYFVKRWLKGQYNRQFLMQNAKIVNTFYSLDRFDYWYENEYDENDEISRNANINIYTKNEGNNCFLFDRYNLSNALYNPMEISYRTTLTDMAFDTYNFKIPQTDICVWMRTKDFSVVEHLLSKKENKDKNETNLKYIKEVWDRSEQLINYGKENTNNLFTKAGIDLVIIDTIDDDSNVRSREDIHNDVCEKLNNAIISRLDKNWTNKGIKRV